MTKEELKQKAELFIESHKKNKYMFDISLVDLLTLFATETTNELEEENAELKARLQKKINTTTVSDYPYSALKLEEAKELLNEFMRISKASDEDFEHDYSELIGETEKFLNGDGCPDTLCEDCTKEDCTVRKLGLIEK